MKSIELATKSLGPGHPCFIIAEGGLNHNGDPVLAADLIAQAAACGADAIKFQTYTPAELFPPDHPDYQKFQQCVFSRETYVHLQSVAAAHRILLLSTPFDEASADLLESLDLPAFKIGSGELTHLAFLRYVAQKGKPILLSTGMSTPDQVDRAVEAIQSTRPVRLALLHCVSAYPCPVEQANIRIVAQWMRRYPQCPIGYSDHTTTHTAALAAVALGACIIEKHFTLSHTLPGWDHFFSYNPSQFKELVQAIRETEAVLGSERIGLQPDETAIEAIARRALYTRTELPAGHVIQESDIVIRRPTGPLAADQLPRILGKTLRRAISAEQALALEDFLDREGDV